MDTLWRGQRSAIISRPGMKNNAEVAAVITDWIVKHT
jgi:hypothetical protein